MKAKDDEKALLLELRAITKFQDQRWYVLLNSATQIFVPLMEAQ